MKVETLIIGSGFSGLAMAIELDRAGRRDWRILEAASSLGGTWRDNRYPGAACDVPSHLYSLSCAPNPAWTHRYARQPEILAYMERLVDDFALRDRIVFDARVDEARWDGRWTVDTATGTHQARFLVHGIGALRDPRWPRIPGLEAFPGPVVHSSRWPDDLDLTGQRVVVIGTGASAIQVVPAIAERAASVTVLQRTAPWVRPRNDRAFSAMRKGLYRRIPALMQLHRLALYARLESKYPVFFGPLHRWTRVVERLAAHQARGQVGPELADAITPDDRIGCKRVLVSDDWYPTLARPDVHLVTEAAVAVEPEGVRTASGLHAADAIVCCTGFRVDDPLGSLEVYGRGGVSLREVWGRRPSAHLGITVPDFPDMFLLLGPNTALGHTSVLIMIEAAVRYVRQGMAASADPLSVRHDVHDAFVAWVDAQHDRQVWGSGCESWYRNEAQENFTIWPGSTLSYLRRTRHFDAREYEAVDR
jgi:cation diffusion facilitator CzcD-associated flavoprotein CzcO